MFEILKSLAEDEDGPTTVEYALLLGLLVVGLVFSWRGYGAGLCLTCILKKVIRKASNAFNEALASGP